MKSVRQWDTNIICYHFHVDSKKKDIMNFAEQVLTHGLWKTYGYLRKQDGGRGWAGGLGWKCYKTVLWWSLYNYKHNKIHWVKSQKKKKKESAPWVKKNQTFWEQLRHRLPSQGLCWAPERLRSCKKEVHLQLSHLTGTIPGAGDSAGMHKIPQLRYLSLVWSKGGCFTLATNLFDLCSWEILP